jgi:hypothetical protein
MLILMDVDGLVAQAGIAALAVAAAVPGLAEVALA